MKGEHSKGSLIHDNATEVLIVGNLYAHNRERNQLFKGAVEAVSANNLIYDPGTRAMHYALNAAEWTGHTWRNGRLALVGNVVKGGASTDLRLPFLLVEGQGDLDLYAHDNLATYADGRPMPASRVVPAEPLPKIRPLDRPPVWPRASGDRRPQGRGQGPGQRRRAALGPRRGRPAHRPGGAQRNRSGDRRREGRGRLSALGQLHLEF